MKFKVRTTVEKEVKYLQVNATVRSWDNTEVNGEHDTEDGDNIPCKDGDDWKPLIELKTGKILNWEKGKTADVHYKVCDAGTYILLDETKKEITRIEGYVPDGLDVAEEGHGDYIIMCINEDGSIINWDGVRIIEAFDRRDAENY